MSLKHFKGTNKWKGDLLQVKGHLFLWKSFHYFFFLQPLTRGHLEIYILLSCNPSGVLRVFFYYLHTMLTVNEEMPFLSQIGWLPVSASHRPVSSQDSKTSISLIFKFKNLSYFLIILFSTCWRYLKKKKHLSYKN